MENSATIEATLINIIAGRSIRTVFQPIYNLSTQQILGFEALSRGEKNSPLEQPKNLFNAANYFEQHHEIEAICIEKAIESFARQNLPGKLFINMTPNYIVSHLNDSDQIKSLLSQFRLPGNRLVIEITEDNPANSLEELSYAIENLRRLDIQFAIDDLGAGYSGLIQWSKIRPNLIKIDRYFVHQCDQDMMKREFLSAVLKLANNTGAMTIVEGIETQAELDSISALGVTFAQGYYLSRPQLEPNLTIPDRLRPSVSLKPKHKKKAVNHFSNQPLIPQLMTL